MKNRGLVATTVNPFGDIEHQLTCFNSWKQAGYAIKTFNAPKEAELLLKHGLVEQEIIEIDEGDTTYSQNQKYLPKILPIVEHISRVHQDVIITNSDIFALHSTPLTRVLKSLAPCLALARREVLSLSEIDPRDNEFYRGGLDLFFLSSEAVEPFSDELRVCEAANVMAFGAPGWDYLAGAIIEQKLYGRICDAPIAAHKYHKNTYSTLNEFAPYARDIARLLHLEKSEPYWVANEYAKRISSHCKTNLPIRSRLQTFFHPNGSNRSSDAPTSSSIKLTDINGILTNANLKRLRAIIKRVSEEGDWGVANQFIPGCFVRTAPMTAKLFTLWNFLQAQPQSHQTLSNRYPEGSLHKAEIKNCEILPGAQRDDAIFSVFASELVNHKIFNKRLFDYLVWSSTTSTQVDILARIKLCLGGA
ncbi:hypothetical protein [Gilvimarinus sp. DA14]|uniref:hypothetical protein n=1 Tax=Gilvimarinus sp. DA14 TaxID=2956798 RepID=UPI0020B80BB3|nr:hypothetical protein [Gilvimarinus sp. DA14]UTF59561.1 hypothetical protein NHM04_13920 [Gilvimarinus sp. DA14]